MAMSDAQGCMLPCGRDVETVWERLDATDSGSADAHEATCAYCSATRKGLVVLRQVAGGLATEDAAPVSLGLVERIMSAVRAEKTRRHHMLTLPGPEPGGLRISEQAVAAVLRSAADSVDGVRARRCRIAATEAVGEVEVEMSLAVAYRRFSADAVHEVRERVAAAAAARVGVTPVHLDLTVEDLYDA
ncbi:Asp23/Gls24 family envelope stress response protein [Streptomyces sp. NPDC096153]|uniref:Asp23/Gls24 family envelope stress response protein n=1 Tax=Streptomyces sp. NPDC096153 TaxID=3155548 RepID=UPI00332FE850